MGLDRKADNGVAPAVAPRRAGLHSFSKNGFYSAHERLKKERRGQITVPFRAVPYLRARATCGLEPLYIKCG